jgi:alanyl-tRNA synthetase
VRPGISIDVGGGRPDTAQAGGKDPSKTREALDAAEAFAAGKA